jgi:hypothetical protein
MTNPFHHDPHPDLTTAIRGVVNESHTHKTVKRVVGEGVIRDTVQRVKNKLRG